MRKHCRKHHPEWLAALDEQAKGERINNRSELYCTVRKQTPEDGFGEASEQPAKRQCVTISSPTTDLNQRLVDDLSNQRVVDSPESNNGGEGPSGLLLEEDMRSVGRFAGMLPFPRFSNFDTSAQCYEAEEDDTGDPPRSHPPPPFSPPPSASPAGRCRLTPLFAWRSSERNDVWLQGPTPARAKTKSRAFRTTWA